MSDTTSTDTNRANMDDFIGCVNEIKTLKRRLAVKHKELAALRAAVEAARVVTRNLLDESNGWLRAAASEGLLSTMELNKATNVQNAAAAVLKQLEGL